MEVDVSRHVRDHRRQARALGPCEAFTYCSSMDSQLYWETMSCVSNGTLVYLRHAAISCGPNLRGRRSASRKRGLAVTWRRGARQVWHEVAVHGVELDAVDAGVLQPLALGAHVRPVSRQHGRDDLDGPRHGA